MQYPFTINAKTDYMSPRPHEVRGSYVVFLTKDLYINRNGVLLPIEESYLSKDDLNSLNINTFEYCFDCTKDDEHHYKMYLLVKREKQFLSIIKIGQFPSMIDIWGFDFDIYKKQLNRIKAYSDFRKAELCFADGFTAGAFTYLRRVFEKMLEEYCKGIDLPYNAHTEAKIDACKEKFDPRIHSMLPGLYKILSKGIHQLDDEEAKNYYLYLRTVIVMQLQHIKEINDKDEQTAALSKTIQEIVEKIK